MNLVDTVGSNGNRLVKEVAVMKSKLNSIAGLFEVRLFKI